MGEKSPKARSLWQRGRWVIYILSGILLLVLLGSFFPRRRERRPQTELLTTPVTAEQLTIRVEGSGAVVPVDTVNLSPKVTGQLEELYVDEGDTVSRGQVLARMDVGSLAAELQQRQAQLVQAEADRDRVVAGSRQEEVRRAQAQVESAEAQVDLTLARLKRFRELVTEGAVSQNELDQYESDARSATASLEEARQQLEEAVTGSRPEDIAAAQAAVAAAEAQVAITQTQLDDADILAPFSGIVTQIYATVGAIVTPTTSASATASATSSSILALSTGLEVDVDVSEANIGPIAVGQGVEVVADAFPNQVFEGQVKRIAPEAVVENNVTTFQVVVTLLTGLEQLRAGMTVDATFVGDTVADALLVPTVAIATEGGELGVRVVGDDGSPAFRPVSVGSTQAGKTQILSGLDQGDEVLLDIPNQTSSAPQPF